MAAPRRPLTVQSGFVATVGDHSGGIYALGSTSVAITSDTVNTYGDNSPGITGIQTTFAPQSCSQCDASRAARGTRAAGAAGRRHHLQRLVTTLGNNSGGIIGYSRDGFVHVTSTDTVSTAGSDSAGIIADARHGDATVTSGTVNTQAMTASASAPMAPPTSSSPRPR